MVKQIGGWWRGIVGGGADWWGVERNGGWRSRLVGGGVD